MADRGPCAAEGQVAGETPPPRALWPTLCGLVSVSIRGTGTAIAIARTGAAWSCSWNKVPRHQRDGGMGPQSRVDRHDTRAAASSSPCAPRFERWESKNCQQEHTRRISKRLRRTNPSLAFQN